MKVVRKAMQYVLSTFGFASFFLILFVVLVVREEDRNTAQLSSNGSLEISPVALQSTELPQGPLNESTQALLGPGGRSAESKEAVTAHAVPSKPDEIEVVLARNLEVLPAVFAEATPATAESVGRASSGQTKNSANDGELGSPSGNVEMADLSLRAKEVEMADLSLRAKEVESAPLATPSLIEETKDAVDGATSGSNPLAKEVSANSAKTMGNRGVITPVEARARPTEAVVVPGPAPQVERDRNEGAPVSEGADPVVAVQSTIISALPVMGSDAESRENRAREFTSAYFAAWSQENTVALEHMSEFYRSSILFYGKQVSRDGVLKEKQRFANRWPERRYVHRPDETKISCSESAEVCTVSSVYDYQVGNPASAKRGSGTEQLQLRLSFRDGAPHIVEENGARSAVRTRRSPAPQQAVAKTETQKRDGGAAEVTPPVVPLPPTRSGSGAAGMSARASNQGTKAPARDRAQTGGGPPTRAPEAGPVQPVVELPQRLLPDPRANR